MSFPIIFRRHKKVGTAAAVFTPSNLSNLALWLRADTGVGTSGAREFNGSSEYFSIADNADLSLGDVDCWWAGWFYTDSTGTRTIIAKDAGGSGSEYDMRIEGGNLLLLIRQSGGSDCARITHSTSLSTGQWYFFMMYHDATNNEAGVCINDGAFQTTSTTGTPFDSTSTVAIGRNDFGAGGQYWDGRLSRLAFGKSPTSTMNTLATTIRDSLYNSGNGKTYGALTSDNKTDWGLLAYWNLNEASGNAIDAHGSNDGTDTNTVTSARGPMLGTAADETSNDNHGALTGFTADQLVQAWKSDTPNGSQEKTAFDETSNNNHGRLINFDDNPRSTDVVSGASGTSLPTDGVDQHINCGNITSLNSASKFSISGWAKQTTLDVTEYLFTKIATWGSDGIALYSFTDGNMYVSVFNGSASEGSFDYSTAVTAGEWFHYSVVYDGTASGNANRLKLYIDGVQQTLSFSGTIPATTGAMASSDLLIGARVSNTDEWTGSVDENRLYDDALTSDEVTYLYNSFRGVAGGTDPTTTNLQGHWKFDEANTRSLPTIGSGYSLEFDGTDDYVDLPTDVTSTVTTTADFSVSFWYKDDGTNGIIFSATNPVGSDRVSFETVGTSVRSTVWNGSHVGASGSVSASIWHHVVMVYDSSPRSNTLYIDGIEQSGTSTAVSSGISGAIIGATTTPGTYFGGKVDDFRTYDDMLTSDEVLYLYTEGSKGTDPTTTNLQGHWKFDDGIQSTTITDGDPVTQWQSKEGSRHLFTQETTSQRPIYRSAPTGFNSQPAIDFDGTDDVLKLVLADFQSTATAGVFFAVFRTDVTATHQQILGSGDEALATNAIGLKAQRTGGTVGVQHNDGTWDQVEGSTTIGSATTYIIMIASSGSAYRIRVNGNDETENVISGTNSGDWFGDTADVRDNVTLGCLERTSQSEFLNARLAEVILYSEDKSTANENQVGEYLATRYGGTWTT